MFCIFVTAKQFATKNYTMTNQETLNQVIEIICQDIKNGLTESNIKLRLSITFKVSMELSNSLYRIAELKLLNK